MHSTKYTLVYTSKHTWSSTDSIQFIHKPVSLHKSLLAPCMKLYSVSVHCMYNYAPHTVYLKIFARVLFSHIFAIG